jgi:hypothetical protein
MDWIMTQHSKEFLANLPALSTVNSPHWLGRAANITKAFLYPPITPSTTSPNSRASSPQSSEGEIRYRPTKTISHAIRRLRNNFDKLSVTSPSKKKQKQAPNPTKTAPIKDTTPNHSKDSPAQPPPTDQHHSYAPTATAQATYPPPEKWTKPQRTAATKTHSEPDITTTNRFQLLAQDHIQAPPPPFPPHRGKPSTKIKNNHNANQLQ